MKLNQVLESLRTLAPEYLAESWDKVGLHVGDPTWRISLGLLCIDLTDAVLQEAIDARASLIVAYHPPIFAPLPAITSLDPKQRIILEAARRRIAIYSPHTALDAAKDGVNDWLCDALGQGERRPIRPTPVETSSQVKLVVFVPTAPPDHADRLRAALSRHRGRGDRGLHALLIWHGGHRDLSRRGFDEPDHRKVRPTRDRTRTAHGDGLPARPPACRDRGVVPVTPVRRAGI